MTDELEQKTRAFLERLSADKQPPQLTDEERALREYLDMDSDTMNIDDMHNAARAFMGQPEEKAPDHRVPDLFGIPASQLRETTDDDRQTEFYEVIHTEGGDFVKAQGDSDEPKRGFIRARSYVEAVLKFRAGLKHHIGGTPKFIVAKGGDENYRTVRLEQVWFAFEPDEEEKAD